MSAEHGSITSALSRQSSTYESIYEPTRPRADVPPVPAPSGGQYRLSGPFVAPGAQGLAPAPSCQPVTRPDRTGREAEVDSLTSLLVHGLDNPQPDFFGETPAKPPCSVSVCLEIVHTVLGAPLPSSNSPSTLAVMPRPQAR